MSLLQLRSLVTVSEMIRVFFLLSTVFSAVTAKDCFHPDGSRASDHLPCRGDDISNTHCCPLGSACLANGLCLLEEDSSLTTGSCTDKTWDEANCFKTCFAGKSQTQILRTYAFAPFSCALRQIVLKDSNSLRYQQAQLVKYHLSMRW